jgi:hypothetical protein
METILDAKLLLYGVVIGYAIGTITYIAVSEIIHRRKLKRLDRALAETEKWEKYRG